MTVDLPIRNGSALSFVIASTDLYPVQVEIYPALASGLFAVSVAVVVIQADHPKAGMSEAEVFPTSSFPDSAKMKGSIKPLLPFLPAPPLPHPPPHPPPINPLNLLRSSIDSLSLLLSSFFLDRTSKLMSSSVPL